MKFRYFLTIMLIIFLITVVSLLSQDFQPTQLDDEKLFAMLGQCTVQLTLNREDVQKLITENKKLKEQIKTLSEKN